MADGRVHYSDLPGEVGSHPPICVAEAKYFINVAVLKRHTFAGVSSVASARPRDADEADGRLPVRPIPAIMR